MRGADKLTQMLRNAPLLEDRARMFLASRLEAVIVVLPHDRPARLAAVEGLAVKCVFNHEAENGMASSIQAGLAAVRSRAALIMPADMPDVTSEDIDTMLAAHADAEQMILRATNADGVAGSPVIFPADCFGALQALQGDASGRHVIKAQAERVALHALPGAHATTDLDTPEDWAAWRALNE